MHEGCDSTYKMPEYYEMHGGSMEIDMMEHLIAASLRDLKDYPMMLCKDDIRKLVPELSQGQLAALLKSPGFPTLKIGRRYYVSKIALLDWLIRQGRAGKTEVEIAEAHPRTQK